MDDGDPHQQIERLEERIEDLQVRLESCRKFNLASRIAMVGGALVLAALLFGVMRFDPAFLAGGAAAVLGGIVLFGSNNSTAKETAAELAAAEADRAALIGAIELRVVSDAPTLH
jgi:hypothetical protein